MKKLVRTIMSGGLVLMAVLALSLVAQAADTVTTEVGEAEDDNTMLVLSSVAPAGTGSLVGNVTFSQACSLGVGIAFDGKNLWYSCTSFGNDLFKADPVTGQVTASFGVITNGGLGALSYDKTRNVIWAGVGGGSPSGEVVYKIDLDSNQNVTGSTVAFNVTPFPGSCSLDDGLAFDANNVGDPSDDVIYYSNDCFVTTIRAFNLSGGLVESFPFAGTGTHNSGLAVGGQLLFEADVFKSIVEVVNKTDKVLQFNYSVAVAGDPNFHPEDMECDTNTFASIGKDVMWIKEAFSPNRAHAFEIPKDTCGVGGQPSAPFTVAKDFRYTNVNFSATPAELGNLLPQNGSKFNVTYVTKPKDGTVSSTNPGQLYGVITVNGSGADTVNITDTFGTQFDVNPDKLGGGVEIIRVNETTGVATVITNTAQVTYATVDNTGNMVTVHIDLDTPLAADEKLMMYIKFQTALKGMLPELWDFVNEADIAINGGVPQTASAAINFVTVKSV